MNNLWLHWDTIKAPFAEITCRSDLKKFVFFFFAIVTQEKISNRMSNWNSRTRNRIFIVFSHSHAQYSTPCRWQFRQWETKTRPVIFTIIRFLLWRGEKNRFEDYILHGDHRQVVVRLQNEKGHLRVSAIQYSLACSSNHCMPFFQQ